MREGDEQLGEGRGSSTSTATATATTMTVPPPPPSSTPGGGGGAGGRVAGGVPRASALNVGGCDADDPRLLAHCDLAYDEEECAITDDRLASLARARREEEECGCGDGAGGGGGGGKRAGRTTSCRLTVAEAEALGREQHMICESLFAGSGASPAAREGGDASAAAGADKLRMSIKGQLQSVLKEIDEDEEGDDDEERRPQDPAPPVLKGSERRPTIERRQSTNLKAQFLSARLRARLDKKNDGALGVQAPKGHKSTLFDRSYRRIDGSASRRGSGVQPDKFTLYNLRQRVIAMNSMRSLSTSSREEGKDDAVVEGKDYEEEEEGGDADLEDISYVRKPDLSRAIEEYEMMRNHPKYCLKQVVLSRRFHLYAHRFGNAQYQRTLVYPTLRQPPEMFDNPQACSWLSKLTVCGECKEPEPVTEKQRTRPGHRFIVAADTQFGILMDGFAMARPNWSEEIEISRKCVAQINEMTDADRPLFVIVCGDLVDTESSFSGAIASWKKVMSGWQRNLVFEQQVKDFKRVWSGLDPDIALVCLCGNHDVGNRPTRASINHWTSTFGEDFLSFWVNGTFNLCLNNCLFSNPTGAPDLFEEQLRWMEAKLAYARENDASHIFVFGHFPWFLRNEEEADDFLTSSSAPPPGWGPRGETFPDSYFTIPYKHRKVAMSMFKKYGVTACFSGHFHQNVVAQTSWGMPMIVTGPLSMTLQSEISHVLANGEVNGIGMRVVDVGDKGHFTHKWTLLDHEEELYNSAIDRCLRQNFLEQGVENSITGFDGEEEPWRNSLFQSSQTAELTPAETLIFHSSINLDDTSEPIST